MKWVEKQSMLFEPLTQFPPPHSLISQYTEYMFPHGNGKITAYLLCETPTVNYGPEECEESFLRRCDFIGHFLLILHLVKRNKAVASNAHVLQCKMVGACSYEVEVHVTKRNTI